RTRRNRVMARTARGGDRRPPKSPGCGCRLPPTKLTLKLSPAPQLAALQRWAQQQAPQPAKPGLLAQLGVVVLVWGLGNALFGSDCGCD
ncbi:MAG TPA: hypothetical protein PKB14_23835, partial [Rubrivivax sp.]|nr:hypothetical protein [Rubrivivax sp.]